MAKRSKKRSQRRAAKGASARRRQNLISLSTPMNDAWSRSAPVIPNTWSTVPTRQPSRTLQPSRVRYTETERVRGRAAVLLDEMIETFGDDSAEVKASRALFDCLDRFKPQRLWLAADGKQASIQGYFTDVVVLEVEGKAVASCLKISLTRPAVTVDAETREDPRTTLDGDVLVPAYSGLNSLLLASADRVHEVSIAPRDSMQLPNGRRLWQFQVTVLSAGINLSASINSGDSSVSESDA